MNYDLGDRASMRYRVDTSSEVSDTTYWDWSGYDKYGKRIDGGRPSWPVISARKKIHMWDIPTKGFKRAQKEGKIFNKPMLRETITENYGLYAYSESTMIKESSGGGSFAGSGLEIATCPLPTLVVPERLIDDAVTKAFAKVSANKSNALLWAGEFKESIAMFYGIGKALYKLYKSTEKQRIAYAKGKLSLKEAQSMTLAILYGIMPLGEAFKQWQEGLFNILPKGRQTFRGFNTHSDSKSYSYEKPHINWKIDVSVKESLTANIRAGVLADIDPPSFTLATILEPRSVVSTAWALSRLSFVVDWFINIGGWLASWSPTVGTKILASWVVIETTHKVSAQHTMVSVLDPHEESQTITGSGNGTVEIVRKLRLPVNPSERPYLPSVNVNLNLDKIFSLILLFGKTSK